MARGFDSKSVSDQQEEMERRRERKEAEDANIRPQTPRQRQLEMARVDVLRRLEKAPEALRPTLQAALDAIDEELKGPS
jgi:hypothetical protein